jgi:hypothetical protein
MEIFPEVFLPQKGNSREYKRFFSPHFLSFNLEKFIVAQEWKFFRLVVKSLSRFSPDNWEHFIKRFCLNKERERPQVFQKRMEETSESNATTPNLFIVKNILK